MIDEISNYIIFLIPLAIFIGRIFLQAKNRNNSQAESQTQPKARYEDEEDDFIRRLSGNTANQRQPVQKPKQSSTKIKKTAAPPEKSLNVLDSGNLTTPGRKPPPGAASRKTPVRPVTGVTAASGTGFLKLASLSPLKQAVIMAEVLGTPKGLQDL